jgi:heat shock protein HslJ
MMRQRDRMMRWLLPGLMLLLAACGSGEEQLADTEWRLVALGDAGAPVRVVEGGATAEFTTATDMTGWTGCNSYGARYSVRGSELRLHDLTWTETGCPSQALFRQEQRMQGSLATVERFEVSGERLALHSEGGQVLVFERVGK